MPATLASKAQEFCEKFLAEFPSKPESARFECDASHTWMRVIDGYPTSGEGCTIDGLPLLDYYDGREPTYLFHVLTRVCEWAQSQGWEVSVVDPGTVRFYPVTG